MQVRDGARGAGPGGRGLNSRISHFKAAKGFIFFLKYTLVNDFDDLIGLKWRRELAERRCVWGGGSGGRKDPQDAGEGGRGSRGSRGGGQRPDLSRPTGRSPSLPPLLCFLFSLHVRHSPPE